MLDYHGVGVCKEECTDLYHDDTCLVGLNKRMQPILDYLEKRAPLLCAPMKVEQDEE